MRQRSCPIMLFVSSVDRGSWWMACVCICGLIMLTRMENDIPLFALQFLIFFQITNCYVSLEGFKFLQAFYTMTHPNITIFTSGCVKGLDQ